MEWEIILLIQKFSINSMTDHFLFRYFPFTLLNIKLVHPHNIEICYQVFSTGILSGVVAIYHKEGFNVFSNPIQNCFCCLVMRCMSTTSIFANVNTTLLILKCMVCKCLTYSKSCKDTFLANFDRVATNIEWVRPVNILLFCDWLIFLIQVCFLFFCVSNDEVFFPVVCIERPKCLKNSCLCSSSMLTLHLKVHFEQSTNFFPWQLSLSQKRTPFLKVWVFFVYYFSKNLG